MKPHRGTSLLMDGNRGGGKAFAVWFSASPPSPLSKTPEKQSKHFYKEIYIVNQLYFNKNISIFFFKKELYMFFLLQS